MLKLLHMHWKKLALAGATAALLVGLGVTIGFFVGQAAERDNRAHQQLQQQQLGTIRIHTAPRSKHKLQRLPPAGSRDAAQLLADPQTPGEGLRWS